MKRRGSGILLHVTSLPSPFGIGDMGPWAYRFVDFLAESGQTFWQILPLNPTDPAHCNSPYHSFSAFACNPILISPERLVEDGLLEDRDIKPVPDFPLRRVDHRALIEYKGRLLKKAYDRFKMGKGHHQYEEFCTKNVHWLEDFAFFVGLKSRFAGKTWNEWPRDIRDREPNALESIGREFADQIEMAKFVQFIFSVQWNALRHYCNERGVQIIGDIPIYVNHDSVDLWAHPELFKLDPNKKPYVVSGVPPDYFSETGQLWGNPIYRWEVLRETGYDWWVKRIARTLRLYDFVRIDHFRGFVAYWEVPADEKTAINGKWVDGPVMDFFNHLTRKFSSLPIIAEDLGLITPDVREVITHFEFPGMKLLLFAFGEDLATNPYIPHNLVRNCIAYTGTHDNNTVRGWFENEMTPGERERLFRYLGREVPPEDIHWELVRLVMMSVANTAIFPMQDILGLGEEARMNRPATRDGNWEWRLSADWRTPDIAAKLYEITETYGRV
jgi:4-alpha-glucanotransferase